MKLVRASEQIDLLEADCRTLIDRDPKPLRLQIDRKSGWRRLTWALPSDVMLRLGIVVGEVAHNLQSALDIAISELVRANGGSDDRSAFPIVVTWNDAGKQHFAKLTTGLGGHQLTVVAAHQPHHRGDEAPSQLLALLAEITNADKHRVVYPAQVMVKTYRVRVFRTPGAPACRVVEVKEPAPDDLVTLEDGTEVSRVRVKPANAQVDMQLDITGHILFSKAAGFDAIASVFSLRETRALIEVILDELAAV